MIYIPNKETGRLIQTNKGNVQGDLWSTWNIDLQSNPGAIRAGKKMKTVTTVVDSANLGLPVAFKVFDGLVWTVAGSRVFKNSFITGSVPTTLTLFGEDTSTGYVTTYDSRYSDLENFNDTLCASTNTKLYSKESGGGTGAWTERANFIVDSYHKLTYFKRHNRLYAFNNTEVWSVDEDWTVVSSGASYFLELPDAGSLRTLTSTSQSLWIGTARGTFNSGDQIGGASLYDWDGKSSSITREYRIPAEAVMACVSYNDSPIILDSNGVLRQNSGGAFDSEESILGRLPFALNQSLGSPASFTDKFVHPNGMTVTDKGTIEILVCNRNGYLLDSTESVNENLHSGIWEWSREHGLVHKHPLVNVGIGSQAKTDYGQNRIATAGALANLKITKTYPLSTRICGAEIYTDATTTTFGIFIDAPYPSTTTYPEGEKFSYFVTQWIQSSGLKDTWQKLGAVYRKFINSTDRLWLKYRTEELDPTEISITWGTVFASTTSFTTTDTNIADKIGYEVEILQGTGGGKTAHIRTITESGGTYTVLLDEVFTGATGTAKARLQNWTKIGVLDGEPDLLTLDGEATSQRVQLKCCMQFTGDNEVYNLALVNKPQTLIQ